MEIHSRAAEREVLDRVRAVFEQQPFMAYLGARLVSAGTGRCELRLSARPELGQQHGFFHGGVIGALADVAAGLAGYTLAPAGADVLTVEFKVNLLAPALGEELVAKGHVLRAGRNLVVNQADVTVIGPRGDRYCAVALQTLMVIGGDREGFAPKPPSVRSP